MEEKFAQRAIYLQDHGSKPTQKDDLLKVLALQEISVPPCYSFGRATHAVTSRWTPSCFMCGGCDIIVVSLYSDKPRISSPTGIP